MIWIRCIAARVARAVVCAVVAASLLAAPHRGTADEVRLLDGDDDSLCARFDLLASAQREIAMSYFAIGADRTAMAHAAMLCEAAQRGVRVRVLVDAMHNEMSAEMTARLIGCGVELREYHPVSVLRPEWTTRRLHDKLLLVDRRAMITGGRNIEDRYFGRAETNFCDLDVLVEGSAATDAAAYFDAVWESRDVADEAARSVVLASWKLPWKTGPATVEQRLTEARDRLWSEISQRSLTATSLASAAVQVEQVRFIHDAAADELARPGVTAALLELISGAQRSIVVETPYLVLSPRVTEALAAARSRGVRISILTNSLTSTNSILAQAGYESQLSDMRRLGIELWEFPGPACLHGKAFLFDERVTLIGSFNLDLRSELRDTQVAIVADSPELAAELRRVMSQHFAQSRPLEGDRPPARAPWNRRLGCNLSRLLVPFVKNEL